MNQLDSFLRLRKGNKLTIFWFCLTSFTPFLFIYLHIFAILWTCEGNVSVWLISNLLICCFHFYSSPNSTGSFCRQFCFVWQTWLNWFPPPVFLSILSISSWMRCFYIPELLFLLLLTYPWAHWWVFYVLQTILLSVIFQYSLFVKMLTPQQIINLHWSIDNLLSWLLFSNWWPFF